MIPKLRTGLVAAASLTFVLATACSSGPPYEATRIDRPDETLAPIQLLDSELVGVVQASDPVLERRPGSGVLEVTVRLRNVGSEDLALLYDVEFLEANGTLSESKTGRTPLRIRRGDTETVTVNSQRPSAENFVMRIGVFR